jgi:putative ubiquitin-RnfH superfamily antitoxin RatB of RatAB toxin-antitoxin module
MADVIQVTLCWSLQPRQVHEQALNVPAGSTVEAVVDAGVQQLAQASDAALSPTQLAQLKFLTPGIWGRKAEWHALVSEGDRVELYRPLKVDPKVARRQRFKRQGKGRTGLFANRKRGAAAGY